MGFWHFADTLPHRVDFASFWRLIIFRQDAISADNGSHDDTQGLRAL